MTANVMRYVRTPNCYKVLFPFHPRLLVCVKRIPHVRYRNINGERFWEVHPFYEDRLHLMEDWAKRNGYVDCVRWEKDEEPIESYEVPPLPELDVPHNMTLAVRVPAAGHRLRIGA